MRRLALLGLLCWPAAVLSQNPGECAQDCQADATCQLQVARCYLAAGEERQAIAILKAACEAQPGDGALVRQLALAYLRSGNQVWAAKRLLEQVQAVPTDAESRAWAAWVVLQQGDILRARQLLEGAAEAEPGPGAQRLALLGAAVDQLDGRDAEEALRVLSRGDRLFPEDRALLLQMRQQVLGDRGEPISVRLQLSGGYTSNAVESAPQDAGSGQGEDTGAPLASLDAVLRFEPWISPLVRPLGELRGKGFAPFSDEAEGYGYINLAGRAGTELGQAAGLVPGTFDWADMIFYAAAGGAALWLTQRAIRRARRALQAAGQ